MIIKTQTGSVRVRFAPSPTGELHLGSARTALFNYLFAKQQGGANILRIEDTDQARYVPGAMDRFFADLAWLGIEFDEGPQPGGPHGPYISSERTEMYQKVAEELVAKGHAYTCWCTPERLAKMREAQIAAKQPPRYDRHCLRRQKTEDRRQNEPYVIRMKIPEGITIFTDLVRGEITINNKEIDDQVLLKSDGFPTYHLAATVDDHAMEITHVLRSEEWLPSTAKHVILYQMFGWTPPQFAHLPLLLNQSRRKLSKRKDGEAVWIATYRKQGYLPEAIVNYLALLGWNPGTEQEFFSLEELINTFSLERVQSAGAIFDPEKLNFMNAHYLRQLTDDQLVEKLRVGGFLSPELSSHDNHLLARWVRITRDRIQTLSEFDNLVWPMINLGDYPTERLIFKKSDRNRTFKGLTAICQLLTAAAPEEWETPELLQKLLEKGVHDGLTNGDVFWPTRVAISGLDASPSPAELLWALGKDESLTRIQNALARLAQTK